MMITNNVGTARHIGLLLEKSITLVKTVCGICTVIVQPGRCWYSDRIK